MEILVSEVILSIVVLALIMPMVYVNGGNIGGALALCTWLGLTDLVQAFVMGRSDWDDSKMNKFRAGLGLATGLYSLAINMVFYGHVLPKMVPAVN